MRLSLLSEGFDFNRPGDKTKNSIMQFARDELLKIINNTNGSRISLTRRLLQDIIGIISEIKIESDEERECVEKMLSLTRAIIDQLHNLSDGPPPEDVVIYLSMLASSMQSFYRNYTRWDRNDV